MILILVLCLAATAVRAQDTTAVCPHGQVRLSCECGCHTRPVNDYDGLNSLRARLANPTWNGSIPNIGTGLNGDETRRWQNQASDIFLRTEGGRITGDVFGELCW